MYFFWSFYCHLKCKFNAMSKKTNSPSNEQCKHFTTFTVAWCFILYSFGEFGAPSSRTFQFVCNTWIFLPIVHILRKLTTKNPKKCFLLLSIFVAHLAEIFFFRIYNIANIYKEIMCLLFMVKMTKKNCVEEKKTTK